ncbi:MAG: hypothetical protein JWN74_1466 [Acidobacteriaceae bacterium]|nr:hypothetical protein [Acidobacteriaceae bacterium]
MEGIRNGYWKKAVSYQLSAVSHPVEAYLKAAQIGFVGWNSGGTVLVFSHFDSGLRATYVREVV